MTGLERQDEVGWRLWQLLTRLVWMLRPEIEPLLRDAGIGSPLGLFACLMVEHHGPKRLTDLAQHLHLPLSTVSGLSDRLVALGFLQRAANPNDRRSVVLQATERTSTVAEDLRRAAAARLGTFLAAMDPETLEGLVAGLTALVESVEATWTPGPVRPESASPGT